MKTFKKFLKLKNEFVFQLYMFTGCRNFTSNKPKKLADTQKAYNMHFWIIFTCISHRGRARHIFGTVRESSFI